MSIIKWNSCYCISASNTVIVGKPDHIVIGQPVKSCKFYRIGNKIVDLDRFSRELLENFIRNPQSKTNNIGGNI